MRISDVLRAKGDQVVTIGPDATVRELVDLLAEHNIGAVVVASDPTEVQGIVSERDVVRGLAAGAEVLDLQLPLVRLKRASRVSMAGPLPLAGSQPFNHFEPFHRLRLPQHAVTDAAGIERRALLVRERVEVRKELLDLALDGDQHPDIARQKVRRAPPPSSIPRS